MTGVQTCALPICYSINKKVKNEKYTGIGQKIGEDTETSTSGYTRKWI